MVGPGGRGGLSQNGYCTLDAGARSWMFAALGSWGSSARAGTSNVDNAAPQPSTAQASPQPSPASAQPSFQPSPAPSPAHSPTQPSAQPSPQPNPAPPAQPSPQPSSAQPSLARTTPRPGPGPGPGPKALYLEKHCKHSTSRTVIKNTV